MADEFCHIHGEVEEDLPGDFRACGECGHIYRTAEELIEERLSADIETWKFFRSPQAILSDADRKVWQDAPSPEPVPVEKIYACPLCTHDW